MNRLRKVVIHCVVVDFQGDFLRTIATESGGTFEEVR